MATPQRKRKYGAGFPARFYARRALRIFPAFYVFWTIYIVLAILVQHRISWPQYLSSFFYFSNYYGAIVQPPHMAMAHTWSLAVEEQFYLLWPWLFRRWRNDFSRLSLILCSVIVWVWIYRLVIYTYSYSYAWLFCAFDCRADHLAIGCLTAVLVKRRAFPHITAGLTENIAAPLITLALLAGSMGAWAALGEGYQFKVGFMLDPVLLAVLMMQWIVVSDAPIWRWLNSVPVRCLGRLSYSAYLYHWIVDNALNSRLETMPIVSRAVIAVVGSNIVAALSYRFIKKPFLRLKKRFEAAPTQASRSAVVQ